MNFSNQKARDLMVENQLRPNKIKNHIILDLFKKIPKEDFLPKEIKSPPYSDLDISLSKKRGYLKNLHIAQLINKAEIKKNQKIMHLGALTGYVSTLLANMAKEVIAVESDIQIRPILEKNIYEQEITNIKVVEGSFESGFINEAPYDLIFIDNPIYTIGENILNQINSKLGKIIMIQRNIKDLNKAFKITKNENNYSKEYLFDVFTKYELYKEKESFLF